MRSLILAFALIPRAAAQAATLAPTLAPPAATPVAACAAPVATAVQACRTAYDSSAGTTGTTICPALNTMIKCCQTAVGTAPNVNCAEFATQTTFAIGVYNTNDCGNILNEISQTKTSNTGSVGVGGSLAYNSATNGPLIPPTMSPQRAVYKQAGVNLLGSNNCPGLPALQLCWSPVTKTLATLLASATAANVCPVIDTYIQCFYKTCTGMLICDDAAAIIKDSQAKFDQFKCAAYNAQTGATNAQQTSWASSGSGSIGASSLGGSSAGSFDSFNSSGGSSASLDSFKSMNSSFASSDSSSGSLHSGSFNQGGSSASLGATMLSSAGASGSSDSMCYTPGCYKWITWLGILAGVCLLCCCLSSLMCCGGRGGKRGGGGGMFSDEDEEVQPMMYPAGGAAVQGARAMPITTMAAPVTYTYAAMPTATALPTEVYTAYPQYTQYPQYAQYSAIPAVEPVVGGNVYRGGPVMGGPVMGGTQIM